MDVVVAVNANNVCTAALKSDGTLWMWGMSESLSDGSVSNGTGRWGFRCQTLPVKVMDNVAAINTNCDSMCYVALKTDGSLWGWDVADETGAPSRASSPIKMLDDVISFDYTKGCCAAVTSDHALWIWGYCSEGRIGNEKPVFVDAPVKMLDDVSSVCLGSRFCTAAIKTDGSLWLWQAGSPEPVKIIDNVSSAVSQSDDSIAVIQTNGTLWTVYRTSTTPEKVTEDVSSVVINNTVTAVIKTDNTLWTWGNNYRGHVGNGGVGDVMRGDSLYQTVPVKIMDGVNSVFLTTEYQAAAVKTDGTLWVWGGQENVHGQLGIGTASPEVPTAPVQVSGLKVKLPIAPAFVPDTPSDWADETVAAAIEAGLVPERLQKNYTMPISRIDAVQMFINLIEQSSRKNIDQFLVGEGAQIDEAAFTDTSDKSVLAANALGIVTGVGGGRFDPDSTFTRAQCAVIINRVAGVMGIDTNGYTHSFTDVSGHWVSGVLGWPVYAGIISGIGGNRFAPDSQLTCEQAIVIVYRALEYFDG